MPTTAEVNDPNQPTLAQQWATALATPLAHTVFTVIDLETTGLNPKRNSITEVTAIRYQNGEAQDVFSTLIQPKEPIPPEVEALTGISNEMVAAAPPLLIALNDLLQFMGPNPVLVGHNVKFDLAFLQAKCEELGLMVGHAECFSPERAVCTRLLAKKVLPNLPSYEGIVVATQCGYHNNNPHRAEADVRMSAAILFTLVAQVQAQQPVVPLRTLGELLTFQQPPQPTP
jgi:DNA polymerase III epsilon subunit-like protein